MYVDSDVLRSGVGDLDLLDSEDEEEEQPGPSHQTRYSHDNL